MIQITQRATIVAASGGRLAALRERFARDGYVKLPGFLSPGLLAAVLAAVDRTVFEPRVHEGIGVEVCARQGAASGALEFLLNDAALHAAVSELTGCAPIRCFEGRIYRLVPGTDHYDSWHSDVGQGRLLAVSINLGRQPFEGGELQIRRAGSPVVVAEVENRTPGDAVLFRIDRSLRHRVAPVTGGAARTAYAGWFRSEPDFRALLRARLQAPAAAADPGASSPSGPCIDVGQR